MTPNTGFTILAFFVFVAPGLWYDLLSAKKEIRRRESTFTEISRIALVSTVCSLVALLTLLAVGGIAARRWGKHPFPEPAGMIDGGLGYVGDHLVAVAWAVTLGLTVSMGAATIAVKAVHRGDDASISYTSSWRKALRDDRPTKTSSVHVRAKLKDGTTWFGQVAHYSPDHEVADRDIVLSHPLATKAAGSALITDMPEKWKRVILSGTEIVSLAVSYGPSLDQSSAPAPAPGP